MNTPTNLLSDATTSSGATGWIRQLFILSKRSTREMIRQPEMVLPSLGFPIFFAFLGNSSFGRTTSLAGFPKVSSFLQFQLAGTITQGVLFGSITAATGLATDIESKYFDRLLVAPTSRILILFGRLAGGVVFGALATTAFIVALVPFGADVLAGLPGIVAMILSGALISLAVGAVMSAVALKTGSAEAVQGSFPLLFVLLFFSSAFFPRELMSGVYQTIAGFNPISHIVEGLRAFAVQGFTLSAVARAVLIPMLIACLAIILANSQLRSRIRAT